MSVRLRQILVAVFLLLLALIVLLFLRNCTATRPMAAASTAQTSPPPAVAVVTPSASAPKLPDEVLTPATLQVPPRVEAGARFRVQWTGPNNVGDYVTIVRPDAAASGYAGYAETRNGATLDLLAPADPGEWEVRYIAARSKTILSRASITIGAAAASLTAPADVIAGAKFQVIWTGPGNSGDYLTVVSKGTPDGQHGNYADAARGSPLELLAPIDSGEAEIRYMTGSQFRVLARRPILVVAASVTLDAPDEAVAGASIRVTWTGPKNAGDYLTIVPKAAREGEHGNYADVVKGSPLKLVAPRDIGVAEIRYMSGQGAKILGRRAIRIVPASLAHSAGANERN